MSYQVQVTMTVEQVMKRFRDYGRGENFSLEALELILEEKEALYGYEPFPIDVIEICGDYSEDTLENTLKAWGYVTLEELQDRTYAEMLSNGRVLCSNI